MVPACKLFKLHSAHDKCESFLMEMIDPENAIGLYKIATVNNAQKLKEKAKEVMITYKEVVAGPEFLEMPIDDVEEYIQNDNLRIPNEDQVYDAVITWIKYHSDERSVHLSQLVKSIRFQFCSSYCLRYTLSREPLIDANPRMSEVTCVSPETPVSW